ncbi:MAG: DinB family protein [Planctomycetaceae bacterium]
MTITTHISPPSADEYADYYQQYVGKVPDGDFLTVFAAQPAMLRELVGGLASGDYNSLHAPYTWTIKQVVGHLIDVERIFSTRVLRIGVGDKAAISGMEHNVYVAAIDYEAVAMDVLLDEFAALRNANVLLVQRMGTDNLARMGVASDNPVSARANLFILCGHVEYHAEIIRRRLGR